jgi:hypothetical protein
MLKSWGLNSGLVLGNLYKMDKSRVTSKKFHLEFCPKNENGKI